MFYLFLLMMYHFPYYYLLNFQVDILRTYIRIAFFREDLHLPLLEATRLIIRDHSRSLQVS